MLEAKNRESRTDYQLKNDIPTTMTALYNIFLILMVLSIVFDVVASKATFQIDLLRYEAQPNKCCDGFKWVPIGPAKCNECDPYFKICMNHIPSGPSKCVTTTRENNVHTTDLTHGNIQPNHLTLDTDSLQGSLSLDVDIKDYDSTTKDDDIDHLFYTFKAVPSPEKVNVVLNGTKVRLTVSLLVNCQVGYYGPTCDIHCVDGSNWFCSSVGTKVCRNGYSGIDCDVKIDSTSVVPSQKNIFTTILNETKQSGNIEYTTAEPSVEHTKESDISHVATLLPQITYNTLSVKRSKTTSDVSVSGMTKEKSTRKTADSQTKDSSYTDAFTAATHLSVITEQNVQNYTQASFHRNTSSTTVFPATNGKEPVQRNKYKIPEPLEIYSCNVMIEGHKVGLHQPVEEIIASVLTQGHNLTERETFRVHVTSSTFERTDTGVAVTDVSFIVQHNGLVLKAVEVSRKLYSPETSQLLANHLHARKLKQYYSAARTDTTVNNVKSWLSDHLPFVSVISSVLLFCLIIAVVFLGRYIHRRRKSGAPKKTAFPKSVKYNEDQTLQMFSNKFAFDTPFALENPLYDYSCDQLQPPSASHV